MKSLVVYYSRTNITKKLAEDIAGTLNCDIEEIVPKVNYSGKLGYARGIKDGASGKIVELEDTKFNPEDYDVVYVGAPVWASRAANPIISYLNENEGKFNNVKFFLTAGSSGFESPAPACRRYAEKYSTQVVRRTPVPKENARAVHI